MVATGTLNESHMILHEKDSVQHTTNAIALFRDAQMDIEEQWACLACLVGSDHSGKMGAAVKEDLKGKQRPQPVLEFPPDQNPH